MKLHFCEAIEIDNLKEIKGEVKKRQQDWIAKKILQRASTKSTKVFDW